MRSALVLGAVALGAIWVGSAAFVLLILVAAAGLGWEWSRLCPLLGPRLGSGGVRAAMVAGFAWLAVWTASLIWLRSDPLAGRINVIGLALIVWGTDIGAYATGRLVGGPRLAPRISPGKTWAGAVGGAALAAGIAAALTITARNDGGPGTAALIGLLLSVLGQLGDLAESAFKRRCGVKDSGRLVPGHGGLLDRLDAALAVGPAAALLSIGLGPGVVLWR